MDYTFIITEYDSDNVDSSFAVLHGRTEHWFNLTQKTYTIYKKGDNIQTETTEVVWKDNIPKITGYIQVETNNVARQLLLEKTRMHEINYFKSYMKIGLDETNATIEAQIKTAQDNLTFLKNYIP